VSSLTFVDDPVPGELRRKLGAIPDGQLDKEIRDMPLDRLARQEEQLGDFWVGCTPGDEPGDLQLTLAQRFASRAAALVRWANPR
jgi:hypothetical protein